MTVKANIEQFATDSGAAIGAIQALVNGGAADLQALTTPEKTSLVLAINWLKAAVDAAGAAWGAAETDARIQAAKGSIASPALDKWASTQDVFDHVAARETAAVSAATTAAVDQITGGAGAAYDSLIEIQNELQQNDGLLDTLLAAVNNRVRYDQPMTLTAPQQANVCNSIGVGDPTFDYAAAFEAARQTALGN